MRATAAQIRRDFINEYVIVDLKPLFDAKTANPRYVVTLWMSAASFLTFVSRSFLS